MNASTTPFALALIATTAISLAADSYESTAVPAPLNLINLSPGFGGYSGDLSLIDGARTRRLKPDAVRFPAHDANNNGIDGTYKLTTGDKLNIFVLGESKLGATNARIDADGNINVAQIAATIHVAGLTAAEAEAAIAAAYRQAGTLAEPKAAIQIQEYAPRQSTGLRRVALPRFGP